MTEPKTDIPAPTKPLGIVVGYIQQRAGYVLPDGSLIADTKVYRFLDLLLENASGQKKLVRVPATQDVADFFAGQAELPMINFRPLEEERKARESALGFGEGAKVVPFSEQGGTATPPQPTGTDCPVCLEPQYETPSGPTCANGHVGA